MPPKAIVTDVNGVLLPFDQDIVSDSVITALNNAHARGIPVILCTSNPYWFIEDIVTRANLTSPQIVNAGRTVMLLASEEVQPMPAEFRKADAVKWVLDSLKLYPQDVLGVGDMPIDLGFLKLCGKVATLQQAHHEVIEYVKEQQGFIAPPVEHDGFVDILEHYIQTP